MENESLSLEQRNALDAVRHACKDGTITNSSLYDLLSNLKPILKLKSQSDKIRVEVPEGIQTILDIKSGDKVQWHPIIVGDFIFVGVIKSKKKDNDKPKLTEVKHD